MPPHSLEDTLQTGALGDDAFPSDPSWAHVSGWNQLSGALRKLSCVVSSLEEAEELSRLLPTLSDTLTECGYPWEVIIVSTGASERTTQLLRGWAEIPGFWSVALAQTAGRAAALTAGLEASRGDAVIILSCVPRMLSHLLPRAILHWESGAQLVYAIPDETRQPASLGWWDAQMVDRMIEGNLPVTLPPGSTDLALLDRRVVKFLLG